MKATWTKVYTGLGYWLDPVKEEKRRAEVAQEFSCAIYSEVNNAMNELFAMAKNVVCTGPSESIECNPSFTHILRCAEIQTDTFLECLSAIEARDRLLTK